MNNSQEYNVLTYNQISSNESRNLSLREKPAVYAWYRSFNNLIDCDTAENFLLAIDSYFDAKVSDKFNGKLGYLYDITIQESGGSLSEKRYNLLKKIAQKPNKREILSKILKDAELLQSPLYVGKAINLRKRIGDHISGYSELLNRFENAGINFRQCVLRYKYIDISDLEMLNDDAEEAVYLVEEILTRLSPAAFVRKPG